MGDFHICDRFEREKKEKKSSQSLSPRLRDGTKWSTIVQLMIGNCHERHASLEEGPSALAPFLIHKWEDRILALCWTV